MSDWLEHSDQVELAVPIDLVWHLWADIENMPQWMNWIQSVKITDEDPNLSRWQLASGSVEFSWLSRILKQIPHQIIQWESIDGLPNRGAIRFYDRKDQGSVVKMSVAFKIPGMLGPLVDRLFLGQLVESNIRGDLERFRDYALQHYNQA